MSSIFDQSHDVQVAAVATMLGYNPQDPSGWSTDLIERLLRSAKEDAEKSLNRNVASLLQLAFQD